MATFFDHLEEAANRKRPLITRRFSSKRSREEVKLFEVFREGCHWHPLPARATSLRPGAAVDGGISALELANGSTLIVAQALIFGEAVEDAIVDVDVLPGTIPQSAVDRYASLMRQKLEIGLAARYFTQVPENGVLYLDGALYSGLPQLYPMNANGLEDPTVALIDHYQKLLAGCTSDRLLVSVAKSSRASLLTDVLQAHLPESEHFPMSDSEMIYRWTDQKAGYSTPVLLGTRSFVGWPTEQLLEPDCAVTQMPAVLSFHVRLADYEPALRVDIPCTCLGLDRRIMDLKFELADRDIVAPAVASLLADHGGPNVYNNLLYMTDREVAIHRDRFRDIYLPILRGIWHVDLEPTLSQARFF